MSLPRRLPCWDFGHLGCNALLQCVWKLVQLLPIRLKEAKWIRRFAGAFVPETTQNANMFVWMGLPWPAHNLDTLSNTPYTRESPSPLFPFLTESAITFHDWPWWPFHIFRRWPMQQIISCFTAIDPCWFLWNMILPAMEPWCSVIAGLAKVVILCDGEHAARLSHVDTQIVH